MTASDGGFSLQVQHGIALLTLDRPEKLNALTFAMYANLPVVLDRLGADRDVGSVVITGRGRAFCSGGDREEIVAALKHRDRQGLLQFTRQTGRLIHSLCTMAKPVIASIHGPAVGAGAVIACACDLRVAAQDAQFGFIFPELGLSGADMGAAYLLPRLVGLGNASELLFLGERIDARHAYRIGLINQLAQDDVSALEIAHDWAKKLARGPRFAHSVTKKMLHQAASLPLAEALEAEAQSQADCMDHPDFRSPDFRGSSSRMPGSLGQTGRRHDY